MLYCHNDINHNCDTNTFKNTDGLCRLSYERVYLFLDFGPWRHEVRDTMITMLTPPQRVAPLAMFKISVGRDMKNPTTSFIGQNPTPNGPIPNSCLNGSISTDTFLKSSKSQEHLFWAWHQPHSSPIFCLGVFYMTNGIAISFARERKIAPNDSKPYQTEW